MFFVKISKALSLGILGLAQSPVISAGMPKSRPRTVTSQRIKAYHNQQACHPWSLDFGIPAEMTRLYLSFLAQTENCCSESDITVTVTINAKFN